MTKRLYRSRSDRKICGVCAGLADYLGIDPTLVRLGWVLVCALGGAGLVAYLVCAMVIPEEP